MRTNYCIQTIEIVTINLCFFWCESTLIRNVIKIVVTNCTAFAPYRVRPYEFAPTLCRVRPHTFRVRPHQVEFAPWLSDIQMSWFVTKAPAECSKCRLERMRCTLRCVLRSQQPDLRKCKPGSQTTLSSLFVDHNNQTSKDANHTSIATALLELLDL